MKIIVTISAPPLLESEAEIVEHHLIRIQRSAIAIRGQYGDVLGRQIQYLSQLRFASPDLVFCLLSVFNIRVQRIPADDLATAITLRLEAQQKPAIYAIGTAEAEFNLSRLA